MSPERTLVERDGEDPLEPLAQIHGGGGAEQRRRARRRDGVPRQHDPGHVGTESDEHGDAAQPEGQRRADAEQNLQPKKRREAEADADRQRRCRASRSAVDSGEILQRAAQARQHGINYTPGPSESTRSGGT